MAFLEQFQFSTSAETFQPNNPQFGPAVRPKDNTLGSRNTHICNADSSFKELQHFKVMNKHLLWQRCTKSEKSPECINKSGFPGFLSKKRHKFCKKRQKCCTFFKWGLWGLRARACNATEKADSLFRKTFLKIKVTND